MSSKQTMKNILEFGIDLELSSEEETIFYLSRMTEWIMEQEDFDATMTSDKDIEVYYKSDFHLGVNVKKNVLTVDPKAEECFESLMIVLGFVGKMHRLVRDEFATLNKSLPLVESEEENEEDSEEDSEWI